MTDEEKKCWAALLDVAKRNLLMPIADKQFRAERVFIAADAELTRLREAVEWACEHAEDFGKLHVGEYNASGFAAELRRKAGGA